MVNYLEKLKEKCIADEKFYSTIELLFDKLLEFGYITPHQVKKLQKKLYDNIDVILIGNDIQIDYKTGYYDSIKKEIYIKDTSNMESIFLRILYAMTTDFSKSEHSVGYSFAYISKADYKAIYKQYGINRAIISNLVCRLLYTVPTTLSIMPTYRTYDNDFLGNKITSDNDIYFLEGKLLKQICYILNLSEEELYNKLFENPTKYLQKFFNKSAFEDTDKLLSTLDNISKNYSTYNKLVYFNKLLNDNYIETKKRILDTDTKDLERQKEKINLAIQNSLEKIIDNFDSEDELQPNIEACLAEEINKLEELIINDISSIQNMLVQYLISSEAKYSSISYAIKAKELQKILIFDNSDLNKAIFETISLKLMTTFESTASNISEKIKYSIINEIISSDKYIKIYKNMKFNIINSLNLPDDTKLVALTVDGTFMQLVLISSLNNTMQNLKNNTVSINIENMAYLLNNPTITKDIHIYEQIFTIIHTKFPSFSNLRIENMYLVNIQNNLLVLIMHDNTFSVLQITQVNENLNAKIINLSESYSVFNFKNMSNLPVVYNKKETTLQRLLALFAIFS